jgi:hypothetical protein
MLSQKMLSERLGAFHGSSGSMPWVLADGWIHVAFVWIRHDDCGDQAFPEQANPTAKGHALLLQ